MKKSCSVNNLRSKVACAVDFFRKIVYNKSIMKIWAKVMLDGRIKKQFVYEKDDEL